MYIVGFIRSVTVSECFWVKCWSVSVGSNAQAARVGGARGAVTARAHHAAAADAAAAGCRVRHCLRADSLDAYFSRWQ